MQRSFEVAVSSEVAARMASDKHVFGPPNISGLHALSQAVGAERAPNNLRCVIIDPSDPSRAEDAPVIHSAIEDTPLTPVSPSTSSPSPDREDLAVFLDSKNEPIDNLSVTRAIARAVIARERDARNSLITLFGTRTLIAGALVALIGEVRDHDVRLGGYSILGCAAIGMAIGRYLTARKFPRKQSEEMYLKVSTIAENNPPIPVQRADSR